MKKEKLVKIAAWTFALALGIPTMILLIMGSWCILFEVFGVSASLCEIG